MWAALYCGDGGAAGGCHIAAVEVLSFWAGAVDMGIAEYGCRQKGVGLQCSSEH
jgi:hypothetical protein